MKKARLTDLVSNLLCFGGGRCTEQTNQKYEGDHSEAFVHRDENKEIGFIVREI